MSKHKWTEERSEALAKFVGEETPVSVDTVADAAEEFDVSERSIASKLRKMGYEVESSAKIVTKVFSEEQENVLRNFVQDNSGQYTSAEIAAAFEGGKFSAKQIQGKLLSMQLTSHVKPTPAKETVKTFSAEEEAKFIKLASEERSLEDIADALGRTLNQVRGKALSLLRSGAIDSIPVQATHSAVKADVLEGVDVASMTVEEIAEQIGKTARGVKTMLTRRGLTAQNYDGAAKAQAKANS